MYKILWQRKRDLDVHRMLISDTFIWHMQLGILVVVFIPKRTRFELPSLYCGGHFRKQMYSICKCFQGCYYAGRRKNVSSTVAVLTHLEATGRENTRPGQSGWLLAIAKMERGKENLERKYFSSVFLRFFFLSSFIIIRIAVSFFVKKYDMACTTANRLLFLINFLDVWVCFRGFWEITEPHVFLNKVFIWT